MKGVWPVVLCLCAAAALPAAGSRDSSSLADLPDSLVGTDSTPDLSRGNTYPAVFTPFAMANWTAQTGEGGWPYQYSKGAIRGFRSTHRPSAWMTDWGPFSFMPVVGELKVLPEQRASGFRHEDEDARAYRYSVLLQDYRVRVDMAPSRHCGILRFRYPPSGQRWLVADANPGGSAVQIHYDYAGQPWKTQKWVREVESRLYKPGPAGWLGDEDTGQTSAWYVFSALGFYPVNPGQPIYALGSPLFDKAAIHLENGKTFHVEARRKAGDFYVQSATLNGKPLDRAWISHQEIAHGGTLRFTLGPKPNERWGTSGLPKAE
jgi:putative alpha-1,2-mannosidase